MLQFETECDRILKSVERQHSMNLKIGVGKDESACHTLLRSVSKLLYKDETGDPNLLKSYLLKDMSSIPVKNFKGKRFNIFITLLGCISSEISLPHIWLVVLGLTAL